MKAEQIIKVLDAKILSGDKLPEEDIRSACGSDMMSDVLAFPKERMVLLTGLTNAHVVRTCEMLDVLLIVFVRGKVPGQDVLNMAKNRGIVVIGTPYTLYEACGLLYESGLPGGVHLREPD
ncbi:hypothetical protein ACH6CV_05690 [Bacillota bacterium Meth-B3]|nr:hypothetical protein [Christensenellaceae bacterium]MEA5064638.1 hypothetical protein [Eubacteriales bacterium]MEA5068729.1 hypothetical protein [Christensenellaceae bacterium]